jgi:uncharacterized coiled-coil protein SlyX
MEISPCQSPNKASGLGTLLVIPIETTTLEDQVSHLTKLVEELSTSLKEKNHEITKLMNKLKSMNEGGQTLATKSMQVDQLDIIEDYTIEVTRNIHGIIDDIVTTNQMKKLIRKSS